VRWRGGWGVIPFPPRRRSCAFLSRFQARPLARQTPSPEAARPALTGGLYKSVRKRPLLKPAQSGAESTALNHRQGNETKRISAVAPFAAGEPPFLYRGAPHAVGFIPMPGRGGARNRAWRTTEALSEASARNLIEATCFAVHVDLPFNRMVTIHWDAARVADDLEATGLFLKLASDWLRRHGGKTAFVWVRENGPGKGRHVHILMHLPPDLAREFNRHQRRWLQSCGAEWRAKVLLSRPVGRSLRQALSGGADYEGNLSEALQYVLKGVDHRARETLGIERSEPGGQVVGKRCGVSMNIGRETRRKANNGYSQSASLSLARSPSAS
jgi:hypothetical protein